MHTVEVRQEDCAALIAQIFELAETMANDNYFLIGELAHRLNEGGLPDREIAKKSNLSEDIVGDCRRVYKKFFMGKSFDVKLGKASVALRDGLGWFHYRTSSGWDDAEVWINRAVKNEWSARKMKKERIASIVIPKEPDEIECKKALDSFKKTLEPPVGKTNETGGTEEKEKMIEFPTKAAEELEECCQRLKKEMKFLRALSGPGTEKISQNVKKKFIICDLENAINGIMQDMPHKECPDCHANEHYPDCFTCEGLGWITR